MGLGGCPGTLAWGGGTGQGLTWCCFGASPRGWEPKSPLWRRGQKLGPGRGGLGAEHSGKGAPGALSVLESGQAHPQEAGFRYAPSGPQTEADPELSADQSDARG